MLYIVLSLTAATGAVLSFRHKGVFHKIIALGLLGAAVSVWVVPNTGILLCIGSLLLLSLLTSQYALIMRNISIPERVAIATLGLTFMAGLMFKIQHWAGVRELHYFLIVPVLLYLFCLVRKKSVHTREFSFMLVWAALSVYELLRFFVPIW